MYFNWLTYNGVKLSVRITYIGSHLCTNYQL